MTELTPQMDAIDLQASLSPQGEHWQLRRQREIFVSGANQCRESVLTPEDHQGITVPLRQALAQRMALLTGNDAQSAWYQQGSDDQYSALAAGEVPDSGDSWLTALVAHCDKVTLTPRLCGEEDIRQLERAGLNRGQIVALSELIAFVNFESRVVTGLRALEHWDE